MLIVEDGTGLADADAYISLDYLQTYADARGITLSDDTDLLEQKIREATEYADGIQRYKAARLTQDQALEFPRDGLIDWSSMPVTGVPKRLKDGVCYLAVVAQTESLFLDQTRGAVKAETIGPISTTYDGSPQFKVFTTFMRLTAQYARPADAPYPQLGFATPASGQIFSVGMDDYPGTADAISPTCEE